MGCNSCQKKKSVVSSAVRAGRNLINAGKKQPDKLHWFKDGVSGLLKCFQHKTIYTDSQIQQNRDVCRKCEFATKDDNGELTLSSQCMAPDPNNNNAPCGCFILCKSQSGQCDLKKWVHLTVKGV